MSTKGKASIEQPWIKFYTKGKKKIEVNFDAFDISLYEYLEKGNISHPNDLAVEYFGHQYTYGEFFSLINQYAVSFKKQGVKPKDIVALCMSNTPEALISFYALNKMGVTVQLIHPLSSEEEIKQNLNKTKAKVVVALDSVYYKLDRIISSTHVEKAIISKPQDSMSDTIKKLYPLSQRLNLLEINIDLLKTRIKLFSRNPYNMDKEELEKLKQKFKHLKSKKVKLVQEQAYDKKYTDGKYIDFSEFLVDSKEDVATYKWGKKDVAVLLPTGGTSGKPKLAMLSNGNFNSMLEQFLISFDKFERGETALAIMPLFHGFGLCSCLHLPLSFGVSVVLIPKFEAKKLYKLYKKKKPEYLIGVPAIFDAIKKDKKIARKVGFSFVKLFVAGGDKLKSSKEEDFNEYTALYGALTKIAKGYGFTEGVAGLTLAIDDYNEPDSIGIPMYGNVFKIVKPGTTEEVDYGEEGEICVSGPTIMLGYYDDPEETAKALVEHEDGRVYMHSGDAGFITPEGILYYTQRLKRMIVCNGYNIHSYQIESKIEELDFVESCELIGKDHPEKGQVPVVYIVLKKGVEATDAIRLKIEELCKQNLAGYALPTEYNFIDELPKTLLNKFAFQELQKVKKKQEAM